MEVEVKVNLHPALPEDLRPAVDKTCLDGWAGKRRDERLVGLGFRELHENSVLGPVPPPDRETPARTLLEQQRLLHNEDTIARQGRYLQYRGKEDNNG